jgi:hypothetical protein
MSTLRAYLGSLIAPVLAHNYNQATAIMRAGWAQNVGLDPKTYGTPLPGQTVTNTTITTNTGTIGGGWLKALPKGAVIALLCLLAGWGWHWLSRLLSPATPPAPIVIKTPAPKPPAPPPPAPTPAPKPTPPSTAVGTPPVPPGQPGWDAVYEEQVSPPDAANPEGVWRLLRRESLQLPKKGSTP